MGYCVRAMKKKGRLSQIAVKCVAVGAPPPLFSYLTLHVSNLLLSDKGLASRKISKEKALMPRHSRAVGGGVGVSP